MRRLNWNGLVRLVMIGALVVTGYPLARAYWPVGAMEARPLAEGGAQPSAGQIVVDARDSLTPAQLQDLNARYGLNLGYNSVHATDEKLLIGTVTPGQEQAVLAALGKEPLVEAAAPLYTYSLPRPQDQAAERPAQPRASKNGKWTPNDPRFSEQWNMQLIGAEEAWGREATGKGVTVAVIDTGVAFENDDHGCYQARDFGGTQFAKGFNFVADNEHPDDDFGHGTHVAGTIAETTNNNEGVAGLAFDATIMPLKVLNEHGMGTSADIADAIRYAADHGAKIINMSLGSSFPDPVMRLACRYAAKKGVLIVCSAGNSSGGPVGYPAAFPECLAVSAVGPTGDLAPYSSVGKEVAIAAPGGDTSQGQEAGVLQNTVLYDPYTGERDDGYYAFQGTSMASPHVAAAAALAMSRGVTDPEEVKQLLQRAATRKGPKEKYGAGVLSASKTVELADAARRDSWLRLLFTLIAGLTGLGVGVIRSRLGGLTRFPFMPLGFILGFLGPDMIFGWMGFGSPFNIILHSALVPLYLLWEADSRKVYRFVAAMAVGMSMHLGWDALLGRVPFSGVIPLHAMPWLWVNAGIGVGVALVAWRRSFARE
jgi:serine protease